MVVIVFIYVLLYLTIWWSSAGYILFLYLHNMLRYSEEPPEPIVEYPTMSVIIPVYNEAELIAEKVGNLKNLRYPQDRVEFIFVDGDSTDDTLARLEGAIGGAPNFRVVRAGCRGKIPQVNKVLPGLTSDIIANTDVDAFVGGDALEELAREFARNPRVGVVGGVVVPRDGLPEEVQYWKAQNRVRILESRVISSSIVTAPLYAFRRGLIESFPEDVIADDIYIPFEANLHGLRAVYSPRIMVEELRTPKTLEGLVRHKLRKINAWITEVFRFSYHLPRLSLLWRAIFFTRALQLLLFPWFALFFLLLTVSILSFGFWELFAWVLGISAVSTWLAHLALGSIPLPAAKDSRDSILLTIKMFLLTTFLLNLSGLVYPFYRQGSSYSKVAAPARVPEPSPISDPPEAESVPGRVPHPGEGTETTSSESP